MKVNAEQDDNQDSVAVTYPAATGFALLLIAAGAMLSLIPEFFYLRDNFGVRINTIFKFYYQVWVLFSIAGAYGVYSLLFGRGNALIANALIQAIAAFVMVFAVSIGLLYAPFGIYSRMIAEPVQFLGNGYTIAGLIPEDEVLAAYDGRFLRQGNTLFDANGNVHAQIPEDGMIRIVNDRIFIVPAPTLDGRRWMVGEDDFAILQCLSERVQGDDAVVLEAERDAYNSRYGRVGSITGIPSVLGWDNHERQWRGASYGSTAGQRNDDVDRIYHDNRLDVAILLLRKYDIDYIMFGQTEREQYGAVAEEKFIDYLPVVCESGNSRIYYLDEDFAFNPALQ